MNGIYTFRWSRVYVVYLAFLCLVVLLLLVPFVVLVVKGVWPVFFLLDMLIFSTIFGLYFRALLKHNVRRVEVRPGQIMVVRVVGTPLRWDDVQEVRPISKEWLKVYATKRNPTFRELYMKFNMRDAYYTAPSIGEFERISNNLEELALVTLADGAKYVINYPRDFFSEGPVARIDR